ncbi:MAG: penicillin-binding protein 2 [Gammaproteobacteria bacterium]|nr:penicillin-binding protein 2 [Gammaproteobacteria bacterium]
MRKRIPIKNHQQEIQLTAKRTMLALFTIFIFLVILTIRLYYLQVYKHVVYSTLSTKNRLELVPVEPTRGLIYDRYGVLLAENIPVFSLDVFPYQIKHFPKTLDALAKIIKLTDNDLNQFKRQLKQHRRFDEIPLKLRLTDDEVARFVENQHRFPGVMIKARLLRHYPFGNNFSHVVGYVGRINTQELNEIDATNYSASHYIGKLGIEKFYEAALHGHVGYEEVENDASGKPIRVLKEIKGAPGTNLYLTLDSHLQFVAEKALPGRGAIVALQPQTGQVLAMVSKPGFDPNLFVVGISQKDYQELKDSPERPLYDRTLRGLYPIASTIKPYLALQGLDTGIINANSTVNDQGVFQLHDHSHVFHDWLRQGHGKISLGRALAVSCNVYFYELAAKMGIQSMDNILERFGFGSLTGIDLEGEIPGVLASPAWKIKAKGHAWYEGDTILSGIGHGYMQATPLQLAYATATLANRGDRRPPYLLLGEQLSGQSYRVRKRLAEKRIGLNDESNWDYVISAMTNVITHREGSAFRFGRSPYTIAAKTGTGQVTKRRIAEERDQQENLPEKLRDNHLFIAFSPVENPVLALAIITENSNTAIETARIIFDFYSACSRESTKASHSLSSSVTITMGLNTKCQSIAENKIAAIKHL